MSDLIRREDAIEKLKASYVHEDGIHLWRDHNNDCIDKLIDKFKSIPSAERKGEWIPCSERLPSEQGQYLVTTYAYNDYHYVDVLSFHKGKFYETDSEWGDVADNGVVAWMPLPKPYGEREGE